MGQYEIRCTQYSAVFVQPAFSGLASRLFSLQLVFKIAAFPLHGERDNNPNPQECKRWCKSSPKLQRISLLFYYTIHCLAFTTILEFQSGWREITRAEEQKSRCALELILSLTSTAQCWSKLGKSTLITFIDFSFGFPELKTTKSMVPWSFLSNL